MVHVLFVVVTWRVFLRQRSPRNRVSLGQPQPLKANSRGAGVIDCNGLFYRRYSRRGMPRDTDDWYHACGMAMRERRWPARPRSRANMRRARVTDRSGAALFYSSLCAASERTNKRTDERDERESATDLFVVLLRNYMDGGTAPRWPYY